MKNAMKHTILSLTLCGLAGAGVAEEVYENDFATRTSGPVQSGRWLERRYKVDTRFASNSNLNANPSESEPFNVSADIQDNWRKFVVKGVPASMVASILANSANETTSDGIMYARFGNSNDIVPSTGVMQSFFNSFSNGVLRLYADLRAPTNWPAGNGYLRVQPLFRESLATVNWADGSKALRTFANWGIQRSSQGGSPSNASKLLALHSTDGKGASTISTGTHQNKHWYRFVMDLNLDAGTFTGKVYDQGLNHPKLTDATGTQVLSFETLKANWTIANAACGPIEGIALRVNEFKTANPADRYREPCFDNLVGEWKAPGATEFVRFYENDFETRRVRTIAPAGTTVHAYVRETPSTLTSWSPYGAATASTTTNLAVQIVQGKIGDNKTVQPNGLNGWRRSNTGGATMGIVRYANGNPALRISTSTGQDYGVLTQTLGESIASGKVRYVYDFRTPDQWWWTNRGVYGILGDARLWGGANQGYSDHIGARLGISANSATAFMPYYNTAEGSEVDTTQNIFKSNTWYRAELVVDLDAKTTVGRLYDLGTTQRDINYVVAESALVYEKVSQLHNTVSEISTIGIAGYGPYKSETSGVVHRHHIYFDNLQVWKDWNLETKTGKLVLKDDFASCARAYAEQVRGQLIGSFHADDGQDHWIRRNNGSGDVWITSGENPCVAAVGATTHSYAVQDLGSCYRQDQVVVQVDMRPPRLWTWEGARAAQIIVGGDGFLNADVGNAMDGKFTTKLYTQFGFGNNSEMAYGYWNGTRFRAYDGDRKGDGTVILSSKDIDASHWYRFKATFNLKANTYDLKIFDQGTAHPASAATAKGKMVAEWKNLGLRVPAEEVGITSICLNTYGNTPILPGDPEDAGLALYDNLVIRRPNGLTILVR